MSEEMEVEDIRRNINMSKYSESTLTQTEMVETYHRHRESHLQRTIGGDVATKRLNMKTYHIRGVQAQTLFELGATLEDALQLIDDHESYSLRGRRIA